jgi:heptaprenyl diphosphate synthase
MAASLETAYLQRINEVIYQRLVPLKDNDDAVVFGEKDLKLASSYLCVSDQSKRARPLLCLYSQWLFSDNYHDDFYFLGVAAEFIHAASLLHDDIIDEADSRRGKVSANRHFGNAKAVLAGDYLLTEAFELLRGFDRCLIDRAIVVVREMTRSAMMELNTRGRADVSASCLRSISRGKTGCLFAWCGFAAAHYAKRDDVAPLLWELGERIGFIFQVADDIKDFHGDHQLKDVCRDIRNREWSLPMMLACEEDPRIGADLRLAFSQNYIEVEEAIAFKDRMLKTSGIERATAIMLTELDQIISLLSPFNKTLGFKSLEHFIRLMCNVRTS